MKLSVITPTRTVLDEEIQEITIPTTEGEITILPNHVPLVSKIKPGEMIIRRGGKKDFFAVTGGFLEVSDNNITVLADFAIRAEDIEIAKAEAAKERAQNILKQKESGRDFAQAESQLRRSLLELKVARKRRGSA